MTRLSTSVQTLTVIKRKGYYKNSELQTQLAQTLFYRNKGPYRPCLMSCPGSDRAILTRKGLPCGAVQGRAGPPKPRLILRHGQLPADPPAPWLAPASPGRIGAAMRTAHDLARGWPAEDQDFPTPSPRRRRIRPSSAGCRPTGRNPVSQTRTGGPKAARFLH